MNDKMQAVLVVGLAGVAVYLIIKAGGLTAKPGGAKQYGTGLSYQPSIGYGDTSKYDAYRPKAIQDGGWGIE
jgi:hypothetical protein